MIEKATIIVSDPMSLLPSGWRITEGVDGYTVHIGESFAPPNWVESWVKVVLPDEENLK